MAVDEPAVSTVRTSTKRLAADRDLPTHRFCATQPESGLLIKIEFS